jgi:hypothetical protein
MTDKSEPVDPFDPVKRVLDIAGAAAFTLMHQGYSVEYALQNLPGLLGHAIIAIRPDVDWDFTAKDDAGQTGDTAH